MKEKIKLKIIQYIDDVFDDIEISKEELQRINTNITKKGSEYLDVIKQLKETQEDMKTCQNYVSSEHTKLNKREKEIDDKSQRSENSLAKRILEEEQLKENIQILQGRKTDIELEIKSITPLKNIKNSLEEEVGILGILVEKRRVENEADKSNKKIEMMVLEDNKKVLRNKIAELEDEHQKELDVVIPIKQDLEKREATLSQRENDFNVIVSRHNKMVINSSARFKVK